MLMLEQGQPDVCGLCNAVFPVHGWHVHVDVISSIQGGSLEEGSHVFVRLFCSSRFVDIFSMSLILRCFLELCID